MANNISLIAYPVTDLAAAKTFYTAYLGVEPYADSPYYVGYRIDDFEVGLDPNGQDIIAYTDTTNIKTALQNLLDAGATLHLDVKDVGGGLLIAQVKEPNGNVLGLRQPA